MSDFAKKNRKNSKLHAPTIVLPLLHQANET